MKVLVGTFNQEKAIVGSFSVIVQLRRLIVHGTRFELMVSDNGELRNRKVSHYDGPGKRAKLNKPLEVKYFDITFFALLRCFEI